MDTIRILIVDDHAVVRQGLAAMLTHRYGMEVVGEAADGAQVVDSARALRPDVIVLDLHMPVMDGIATTLAVRREDPDVAILILTSFSEEDRAAAALAAGASGYILKDSSADELIQAIRSVHSGHLVLSRTMMGALAGTHSKSDAPDKPDALTTRELEVLREIGAGLTNQGIALKLGISATTVRAHVSSLLSKLGASNRTQAVMIAQDRGLL
jgi:DNA-binding NarL/FixJ family response regulator